MKRAFAPLALLVLLGAATPSFAVVIDYQLTNLGGSQYRYDYTVTNDGSLTPEASLFDILFDPALYDESSLTNLSTAPGWDILLLGSGIGVPAAFDAFATGPGIGVGQSLGGFAVSFNWLGADAPGAQRFQILDAQTFDLLGEGTSTASRPTSTSVPEPATLALLALGLVGVGLSRRRAAC